MSTHADALHELEAELAGRKHDCGCGKNKRAAAPTAPDTDIPSLDELEDALRSASTPETIAAGAEELELAALDEAISAAEELDAPPTPVAAGPVFEDVLRLIEQYPGLKVTLSY